MSLGNLFNNDEYCNLFSLIFFPIILDMVRIDISYLIVFTYYILSHFYAFIDAICGYIFVYLLGALYSINYFSINVIFLLPYLLAIICNSYTLPSAGFRPR